MASPAAEWLHAHGHLDDCGRCVAVYATLTFVFASMCAMCVGMCASGCIVLCGDMCGEMFGNMS